MEEAREYVEETWATLERRLWLPEHGLYAEEADENWRVDPYRSESGNLHMTEGGRLSTQNGNSPPTKISS